MAMGRKQYQKFAQMLSDAVIAGEMREVTCSKLVARMAAIFRDDNPRFDEQRFRDAVYDEIKAARDDDDDDDDIDDDDDDFYGDDDDDDVLDGSDRRFGDR